MEKNSSLLSAKSAIIKYKNYYPCLKPVIQIHNLDRPNCTTYVIKGTIFKAFTWAIPYKPSGRSAADPPQWFLKMVYHMIKFV